MHRNKKLHRFLLIKIKFRIVEPATIFTQTISEYKEDFKKR